MHECSGCNRSKEGLVIIVTAKALCVATNCQSRLEPGHPVVLILFNFEDPLGEAPIM